MNVVPPKSEESGLDILARIKQFRAANSNPSSPTRSSRKTASALSSDDTSAVDVWTSLIDSEVAEPLTKQTSAASTNGEAFPHVPPPALRTVAEDTDSSERLLGFDPNSNAAALDKRDGKLELVVVFADEESSIIDSSTATTTALLNLDDSVDLEPAPVNVRAPPPATPASSEEDSSPSAAPDSHPASPKRRVSNIPTRVSASKDSPDVLASPEPPGSQAAHLNGSTGDALSPSGRDVSPVSPAGSRRPSAIPKIRPSRSEDRHVDSASHEASPLTTVPLTPLVTDAALDPHPDSPTRRPSYPIARPVDGRAHSEPRAHAANPPSPDISEISFTERSSPRSSRSVTPQRKQFIAKKTAYSTPKTPLATSLDEPSWTVRSRTFDESALESTRPASEVFATKTAVVRVRPFMDEERTIPRRIVSSAAADRVLVVNPRSFHAEPDTIAAAALLANNTEWAKDFRFTRCLWSVGDALGKQPEGCAYASQQDVFETVGEDMVDSALEGTSVVCFAYGHTGAGKTYSMFGDCSFDVSAPALREESGLVPRTFSAIMHHLRERSECKVFVTFLEIHNERIRDLLRVSETDIQLRIREHPSIGTFVENLVKVEVYTADEVLRVIKGGLEKRSVASTARNAASSRSHAVITLELVDADDAYLRAPLAAESPRSQLSRFTFQDGVDLAPKRESVRVQMVDLAGSEKDFLSKDFADVSLSTPSKHSSSQKASHRAEDNAEVIEMKQIRKSLSTLGYIIKALSKGSSSKGLPYRDSVLTWLLKDSLCSGKCHTTMIANVSPSHLCYEETLSTLKYAQRLCLVGRQPSDAGIVKWADQVEGTPSIKQIIGDLGAARPGTEASRMLLKNTLNDPQQRLARLDSADLAHEPATSHVDTRLHSGLEPSVAAVGDLRDGYRALRGQNIELQIEVESARADRDILLAEIQSLREAAEGREIHNVNRKVHGEYSSLSWEREKNELRATIARKDDSIDKLLTDLASEKLSRAALERLSNSQMDEFSSVTAQLQGRIDALHEELKTTQMRELDHRDRAKELESSYSERLEQVRSSCNKQIKVMEDGLRMSESRLTLANKLRDETSAAMTTLENAYKKEKQQVESKLKAEVESLEKDRDELLVQRESHVKLISDLTHKVNDIESASIANASNVREAEVTALVSERDSLLKIIDQQNKDHEGIQKMTQASLRMLQQRQSFLDKSDADDLSESMLRLQDDLFGLLAKEGTILQSEMSDAKRLTQMIAATRQSLHNMLKDKVPKAIEPQAQVLSVNRDQEIIEELNYYKKAAADADQVAHYWKSVAENKIAPPHGRAPDTSAIDSSAYVNEVATLRLELEEKSRELEQTKKSMNLTQLEMQKEFAELWLSVQQLSGLDSVKDRELLNVTFERDRIAAEREETQRKFRKLKTDYKALQQDLQAIDDDLIRAVDAEGISVDELLNRTRSSRRATSELDSAVLE